ncbi:MAG: hypothetical protein A2X94_12370 [Bdellovibrionales bacterium GWB1_55_8]|nr:MAG: hypothetical protein A2X94_12370 [Bdellovibrionales bacterium GWB1_55_8]
MVINPRLVRLTAGLVPVLALGWSGSGTLARANPPPVAPKSAAVETVSQSKKATRDFLNRAAHAFNDITEQATPAVVSISTVKTITAEEAGFPGEFPEDLPFGDQAMPPEGGVPGNPGLSPEGPGRSMGIGSGIIIREDGLIMTNNHVVENAERITVTLNTDDKLPKGTDQTRTATLIGADAKSDLAILKIQKKSGDPARFPVLPFGNSTRMKVGDWAIAIGSPFGLSRSVSFGIISYIGRGDMGVLDIEDFIQTDAAINPGSSGGPLLNARGEVIGINTAIFSQGGSFTGIGFAIPSNLAQGIVAQLIQHGRVQRGWLGVSAQDLDEQLAGHFSVAKKQGALISNVNEKSPASEASIRAGDVILNYGGAPVRNSGELKALVGKTPSGKKVAVKILRKGSTKDLAVTIAEEPLPKKPIAQLAGQAAPAGAKPPKPSLESLGIAVEDIPAEIAEFLGSVADEGALVVGIRMGSAAFDAGLAPGDIILKANDTEISKAADLAKATGKLKAGQAAILYVQRGPKEKVFIPLKTTS